MYIHTYADVDTCRDTYIHTYLHTYPDQNRGRAAQEPDCARRPGAGQLQAEPDVGVCGDVWRGLGNDFYPMVTFENESLQNPWFLGLPSHIPKCKGMLRYAGYPEIGAV